MEMTIAIIGAIAGFLGSFLGVVGISHNRYETMHDFFEKIDSKDFIAARHAVYTTTNLLLGDENAAYVVNFFHQWGLFVKKHYLPIWVFDGATGAGAMRLFVRCIDHINLKRKETHDDTYGEYFEWLFKKLWKRGKSPRPLIIP